MGKAKKTEEIPMSACRIAQMVAIRPDLAESAIAELTSRMKSEGPVDIETARYRHLIREIVAYHENDSRSPREIRLDQLVRIYETTLDDEEAARVGKDLDALCDMHDAAYRDEEWNHYDGR